MQSTLGDIQISYDAGGRRRVAQTVRMPSHGGGGGGGGKIPKKIFKRQKKFILKSKKA